MPTRPPADFIEALRDALPVDAGEGFERADVVALIVGDRTFVLKALRAPCPAEIRTAELQRLLAKARAS